ncbi:hypothetical protein CHCC14810_2453 [Bacillus licheniformis]|nr:hypothetical protein CHCC14810_2453 [Bacillus licheniformis]
MGFVLFMVRTHHLFPFQEKNRFFIVLAAEREGTFFHF